MTMLPGPAFVRLRRGMALIASCAAVAFPLAAVAQTTDCDGNGVDDDLQWGPYYAYWDGNGAGNDGGSLNNWFEWCGTDFTGLNPLDRLVFGQNANQTMDLCTMNANLLAWSLKLKQGSFEISGDVATLTLNGTFERQSVFAVNGVLALDANVIQNETDYPSEVGLSQMVIGDSSGPGVLEVRGHSLVTDAVVSVGSAGEGELRVLGGSVDCVRVVVGSGCSSAGCSGRLAVGPAGRVDAHYGWTELWDTATIDGIVDASGIWAQPSPGARPTLEGTGELGDGHLVAYSGLDLVPRLGIGPGGVRDATLTIRKGSLWLREVNGASDATLAIGVSIDPASQAVSVPRVDLTTDGSGVYPQVKLGGLLRLGFGPNTASAVTGFNPVVRCDGYMHPDSFDILQVTGLPADREIRLERRPGAKPTIEEVGFLMVGTEPPPTAQPGPTAPLLRVAVDAVLADFNGDGVKDAAMAMAMDASGTSQVRFFEVAAGNTLTLKASVDVVGEARQLAALPGNAGAGGIALSLGTAGTIALLRGGGDWQFSVDYVATGADMAASGVATGRFVDPDAPAAQEIAVGCIGAGSGVNAVKVFTPNSAGVYGLAATVAGVRADLLRSGRFDDRPGQDLMAIDRAGFQAKFIVGLDLSAQGVHTVDLGNEPTGAATMNLAGPLGVQGAVIATLGVSSNPDSPVGNGTITRWASGSIVVAARINLGDDPLSVTSADFDEDGDDDLAAATTVAGVEQVRLTYNRTSSLMPGTLYFQDGGKMPGEFFRPRIVMACDADTNGVPKLLSVNAGVGSGGSLGPEMDGGIGTFGSGSGQPGDVNGDGVVDGNDMTAVFSAWGTADPVADINDDGNVDAFDMGVILSGWTAP